MTLAKIYAFDDYAISVGENAQDFSCLALVVSGQNLNGIVLLHMHLYRLFSQFHVRVFFRFTFEKNFASIPRRAQSED